MAGAAALRRGTTPKSETIRRQARKLGNQRYPKVREPISIAAVCAAGSVRSDNGVSLSLTDRRVSSDFSTKTLVKRRGCDKNRNIRFRFW